MSKSEKKDIIEELAKNTDRTKTSIYISEKIWHDFRKECKTASPSLVLERLIQDFLDSRKKRL